MMRLSRRSSFLEDLWETGTLPDMDTLTGGFDIELATGPMPNIPWLNHRKYIFKDEKKESKYQSIFLGYNLIGPLAHWKEVGKFEAYPAMVDDKHVLQLFYKDWKVVDYIVEIKPNLLLGRIHICNRFMGFFYMSHTWDFPAWGTVSGKGITSKVLYGIDLAAEGTQDVTVFRPTCPICKSPDIDINDENPPEWQCNRCDASGVVNVSDV